MNALKFITCGSVDDGKSTLIGRLLVDSRAVLQDQLAGVQRQGQTDLALLTDGLSAEREQGITIDVAYRYFNTARRKFIIGDAPGHEQYTRNMVTAASSADAAVVLVDATKLDWQTADFKLLAQTRRHALLAHLLRVPSLVFAINKLDAVSNPTLAFGNIRQTLLAFAQKAGLSVAATVPISALHGWNVVDTAEISDWCSYDGLTLLQILEQLTTAAANTNLDFAFPVQWVEKRAAQNPAKNPTHQGSRVFWGRLASGRIKPGDTVAVFPGNQAARVAQVFDHARSSTAGQNAGQAAGQSAGIVLDREIDVSRGDWLLAPQAFKALNELTVTVAWMDTEPLVAGRVYWALQGHRWVKARVKRVLYRLDIQSLAQEPTEQLLPNDIGQVELVLQEALPVLPFAVSRNLGALILVDTASHATAGAVLLT